MKRKKTVILLSVLLVLIGLILTALIFLPYYIKNNTMRALASASGLKISVGDVTTRGFWIKFHDLAVCSEDCGEQDPFIVKVALLRILPDFLSALRGKTRPSRMEVSGLRLKVDLSTPENAGKLMGTIAKVEKLVRGSGKGSKGGPSKPGGGGGGAALKPIPVSSNNVDLEIFLPHGISMRSRGASSTSMTSGSSQEISLGHSVLSGEGFRVDVEDISVEIASSPSSGFPVIQTIAFHRPTLKVRLPPELISIKLSSGRHHGEPGPAGAQGPKPHAPPPQPAALQPGLDHLTSGEKLFSKIKKRMETLPAVAGPLLGSATVQMITGEILLFGAEEEEPLWRLSKVSGSIAFDSDRKRVEVETFGDMEFLPFKLSGKAGVSEVTIDADLPMISLKHLQEKSAEDDFLDLTSAMGDVSGQITLDLEKETVRFEGRAGLREFGVNYYRLAADPVADLYLSFSGTLDCTFSPLRVSAGDAEISMSGVPVALKSFSLARREGRDLLSLSGQVPVTDCQKLFTSLPFAMRENLGGFRFGGVMGADFNFNVDFQAPDDAVIDFSVKNQCEVIDEGGMKLEKYNRAFVHEVEDKLGKHKFIMGPGSDNWTGYDEISPYVVSAVITCEDGAFYHHSGVSFSAIKRAVKQDLGEKGFFHGASTITMQLSKNLFLSREKTIARKLQEIILSWWLERSMDKDNIMELYLNVVEFGPEIYGIRNAAHHYFGKEPGDLNVLESVFIAKMLPNPVARYKHFKQVLLTGSLEPDWRKVLERVAGKMYERGYISQQEYEEALKEDLSFATAGANPYDDGQ